MKKFSILKLFFSVILFIAGLILAAWFFMPWRQIGEAALQMASSQLPPPAAITYSSVEPAGSGMRKGFAVNDLEISSLMMTGLNMSFETFTLIPDVTASLLALGPVFRLEFSGAAIGDVAVTPLKILPGITLGSGRLTVSAGSLDGSQGVFIDGLRTDGELSVNGAILIDPSAMGVTWADAVLDVRSQAFDETLRAIEAVGLPLVRESPGRWIMRKVSE